MDVLMNEDHHGIISFLEHGNGFIIHKKRVFAAEVLPKYFKASKARAHSSILESTVSDYSYTSSVSLFQFTSFTRKLNRYVTRGPGLTCRVVPRTAFQCSSDDDSA
jgi:HSF-type DNA-binding